VDACVYLQRTGRSVATERYEGEADSGQMCFHRWSLEDTYHDCRWHL